MTAIKTKTYQTSHEI